MLPSDGSLKAEIPTTEPSLTFATHIVNAFEEEEDTIIFDLAVNPYENMAVYILFNNSGAD